MKKLGGICVVLILISVFAPLAHANFLPSVTGGNIGIGTTAATEKLEVSGTVKATAFAGNGAALTNLPAGAPAGGTAQVQYNNAGALGGASGLVYNNVSGNVGVGSASPVGILDVVGALIVLAKGNVGVGSAAPSAKLDVLGDINLNGNIRVSNSANKIIINLQN